MFTDRHILHTIDFNNSCLTLWFFSFFFLFLFQEEAERKQKEEELAHVEECRVLQDKLLQVYERHAQVVENIDPELMHEGEILREIIDKADADVRKQVDKLMSTFKVFDRHGLMTDPPSFPSMMDVDTQVSVDVVRSPTVEAMVREGLRTTTVPESSSQKPPKKKYR